MKDNKAFKKEKFHSNGLVGAIWVDVVVAILFGQPEPREHYRDESP